MEDWKEALDGAVCVDLFAGAGGVYAATEALGIPTVMASEWDADACATLRAASCGAVVEGDLRGIDGGPRDTREAYQARA